MGLSETARTDVHAHVQDADLAPEAPNQADFDPGSVRAGATRARAISHLRLVGQGSGRSSEKSARQDELSAALAATGHAAQASDWAGELMSPVEAIKQIAPAKGEASNWIIWLAMSLAGLSRAGFVSVGYLIARGGETRIRAGVAGGLLLLAVALSWLAGAVS